MAYIPFFLPTVLLTVAVGFAAAAPAQHVLITRNATLSFYSYAPIEDIKAGSTAGEAAINTNTRSVYCKVPIRSFQFRKSRMQEHFNEKYLQSDRYPYAEFSGRIVEDIDLKSTGSYPVTVQGRLTIHNVSKDYTARATLELANGTITATTSFNVTLADHNISIPTLLTQRIAEIVEVKVKAVFAKHTSIPSNRDSNTKNTNTANLINTRHEEHPPSAQTGNTANTTSNMNNSKKTNRP